MSKRSKYTKEQKYEILKEIELGKTSIKSACIKFDISPTTYRKWRFQYSEYGIKALEESKTSKRYSKELKQQVVLEYLSGKDSQENICKKYEISSQSVLHGWIKRYTNHNELNTTKGRVDAAMIKGRNTNLKDRIEIVKYCIEQNKNYHLTSETYEVSYQQVYQWVKKYEELGKEGLVDRRGKVKLELNKEDKEKIEMRKLKKDNERLRMENDFLKKLQEIERRGY